MLRIRVYISLRVKQDIQLSNKLQNNSGIIDVSRAVYIYGRQELITISDRFPHKDGGSGGIVLVSLVSQAVSEACFLFSPSAGQHRV